MYILLVMSFERRIRNEMKYWPKEWVAIRDNKLIYLTFLMNKKGEYVNYLNNEKNNSLINKAFFLHINITDEYPFKPPKILCNEINLLTIYRDTHNNPIKFLKEDMHLVTGRICGCCKSYLCGDNWGATLKILDIINEFREFWIYWNRVIERFHCKKITEKYLIEDLFIYEYL